MRCYAIALAVALVGCIPPPKQAGGLREIDHRGLEHRMKVLCRIKASEFCPVEPALGTSSPDARLTR